MARAVVQIPPSGFGARSSTRSKSLVTTARTASMVAASRSLPVAALCSGATSRSTDSSTSLASRRCMTSASCAGAVAPRPGRRPSSRPARRPSARSASRSGHRPGYVRLGARCCASTVAMLALGGYPRLGRQRPVALAAARPAPGGCRRRRGSAGRTCAGTARHHLLAAPARTCSAEPCSLAPEHTYAPPATLVGARSHRRPADAVQDAVDEHVRALRRPSRDPSPVARVVVASMSARTLLPLLRRHDRLVLARIDLALYLDLPA